MLNDPRKEKVSVGWFSSKQRRNRKLQYQRYCQDCHLFIIGGNHTYEALLAWMRCFFERKWVIFWYKVNFQVLKLINFKYTDVLSFMLHLRIEHEKLKSNKPLKNSLSYQKEETIQRSSNKKSISFLTKFHKHRYK